MMRLFFRSLLILLLAGVARFASAAPPREKDQDKPVLSQTHPALFRSVDRKLRRNVKNDYFVFSTTQVFAVKGQGRVYDVGIHMMQGQSKTRDEMVAYLVEYLGSTQTERPSVFRLSRTWTLFGSYSNEEKAKSAYDSRVKIYLRAKEKQKQRRSEIAARRSVVVLLGASGPSTPGGFGSSSRSRAVG